MSGPATVRCNEAAALSLRKSMRGSVLAPGDTGYDAARRVYNGCVDRHPALIACCADVHDVVAAVRCARSVGWPLAVRGGGHSAAGHGVCDGGLVIDLSGLKGARVDPQRRVVRAGAGLTWAELDSATQTASLATTGARISSTGIAGVTLGGGYGWLMREHGLAVDNLLAVDIVSAEAVRLRASATEHPELFWGVRGGGGNFGVVTALEYRLHPISSVITGGVAFYPAALSERTLRCYRDVMAAAPDELSLLWCFLTAPPAPFVPSELRGRPVVAISVCHTGPPAAAERDLAPLRALGRPLVDRVRPMSYAKLQRLFDAAGAFGHGICGRSGHLPQLGDGLIETISAHAAGITSPLSVVMLAPLGGAVRRAGEHATACGHRDSAFAFSVNSVWTEPHQAERHVRWTHKVWKAVRPHTAGVYVNELGDEGEARVREAYDSVTYRRLGALKARYDPDNCFRFNQNIPPPGPGGRTATGVPGGDEPAAPTRPTATPLIPSLSPPTDRI